MPSKSTKTTLKNTPCDGRYSNERYDPSLPHCTQLELSFDGEALTMTGGKENYRYPAVSGRPTQAGKFSYTLAAERAHNSGPIPEGVYWINPDELWKRGWLKNIILPQSHQQGWGNYRITIHPFTTTITHCRGGFFIHGGSLPGSAGCIDLTLHMPQFVNDLSKEGAIKKCQIHLVVNYGSKHQ